MKICGIDPGLKGGLAVLEKGKIVEAIPMPLASTKEVCVRSIKQFISRNMADLVVIEKPQTRPVESNLASLTTGINFGRIVGALELQFIPIVHIHAKIWTKYAHTGVSTKLKAKEKSLIAAKRLYPDYEFVQKRCKKPHDGIVDAVLIALWGTKNYGSLVND